MIDDCRTYMRRLLNQISPPIPIHPLLTAALLTLFTIITLFIGKQFAHSALRFSVVDAPAQRSLVGFHDVEFNQDGAYRWSQPGSILFLYGFDGRDALIALRLAAPRPQGAAPATIAPRVGSFVSPAITVTGQWRRYQFIVPTNPTGDTAVQLNSSAFQPDNDPRTLGVAIRDVAFRSLDGGALPPLQRMIFLGTLPLLGWLLLTRIGVGRRIAFVFGATLAISVGFAAAYPLTAGYLLPTFAWPWWPIIPLVALVFATPMMDGAERIATPLRSQPRLSLWCGLALALIALIALRTGLAAPIGITLALLGATVALIGLETLTTRRSQRLSPPHTQSSRQFSPAPTSSYEFLRVRHIELPAILAITGLAFALRFYHLDHLPAGLWRDEARHGLLALRIWQDPSFRPVYVVGGADLPALLFYLMSPILGMFGPHVWSLRLVSATLGALTPLALWWATRPIIGPRAALLSAAFLTWASWSLSMSRWAFPATLDQLLLIVAIGLIWRALSFDNNSSATRQRIMFACLSALCAGLATYGYHSGRFAPIIVAVVAAVRIGASPARWKQAGPALLAAVTIGIIVISPLLRFIADDYDGYSRRVAAVAVFNSIEPDIHSPLLLLLRNAERYLLMWHVRGEPNGRHHAPDAPMVDPFVGLLFLLGIGWALRRAREPVFLALVLWLGLSAVPGIFSTDAPHAMRGLGMLAPACLLAGVAMTAMLQNGIPSVRWNRVAPLLGGSVLIGSLSFNGWLYFVSMANNPQVLGEFEVDTTIMARIARAPFETDDPALRQVQVFLPAKTPRTDVGRLLTSGIPVKVFDGDELSAPPGEQALILLPPTASPEWRAAALDALGPDAIKIEDLPRDPSRNRPLFLAYAKGDDAVWLMREELAGKR
jgi:4-amino-4-deoxy-L-arabinose transferase-like glycosyltransferase